MMSGFPLLHEKNTSLLSLSKSNCAYCCVNLGEFLDSFADRGGQQQCPTIDHKGRGALSDKCQRAAVRLHE